MSLWIGERAKKLGLRLLRIDRSKSVRSDSRYILVRDQGGRDWNIRISAHHRADRAVVPHIDLLTRDGVSGRVWLENRLADLAAGKFEWFDHKVTGREPPSRIRRLIDATRRGRFYGRLAQGLDQ